MDTGVVEFADELRTFNGFMLDRQWHWLRGEMETTKKPDIGLAILSRDTIPRDRLISAGFQTVASFEHSENWMVGDGTPVQFTDDPALAAALSSAGEIDLEGVTLRVIGVIDLLHERIRAGNGSARRRSKRLQDLSDAQALLEANPDLARHLRPEERDVLDRCRSRATQVKTAS